MICNQGLRSYRDLLRTGFVTGGGEKCKPGSFWEDIGKVEQGDLSNRSLIKASRKDMFTTNLHNIGLEIKQR